MYVNFHWFTVHHLCSTACHCVDLIACLKLLLKSITNALENQLFFIPIIIHRFCHYAVHSHCILQIVEVYLPVGFFVNIATLLWIPLA